VLIMLLVAYGGTLEHSFQFDDYNNIANNEKIRTLHLPTVISSNFFRPVLFITFALNHHFLGPAPFGYHLVNIGLHFLNVLLVFQLIYRLVRVLNRRPEWSALDRFSPALLGAAVFGLHPLQTESVTFIVSRSSVLCTCFILLTVSAYLSARIGGTGGPVPLGRRIAWLTAGTISFILAVGTKELGACAPLLLLLLEFLFFTCAPGLTGRVRNIIRYHLPFLVLIMFGAGFRLIYMFELHNPAEIRSPWLNLFSQFRVVVRYMLMLFLPVNQNVDPDVRTSESFFEPAVLFSLAVILLLLWLGWLVRKRLPLAALGIFVWFTSLLPTSSIIPLRDLMAEHRVYLPMVGAALLASTLPSLLAPRPAGAGRVALAATLVVGLALTWGSFQRNRVWENELTLWADSVAKSPEKERPMMHYANAISARGRYQEALPLYEKALRIDPDNATARYNLGIVLKRLGDYPRAVEEWRKVVAIDTAHPNVHNNLGNYHLSRNELEKARVEFIVEINHNPRNPLAYFNYGTYWRRIGERGRAERNWRRALRLKGDLETCRLRLGTLYYEDDRLAEAEQQFQAVLEFNPASAPGLFNLGNVRYKQHRVHEAVLLYERSAAADRTFADPLVNAGSIYLNELKQPQRAAALLREALRRNPNHSGASFIRQALQGMGIDPDAQTAPPRLTP